MERTTLDAVVIGGGIAGLVSALRLAEQGARVMLVEKGEGDRYPCNTRMSGGAFHVAHRDVEESPEIIRNAIHQRTAGEASEALADAVANGVGEATRWLKSKGARFIKVGHEVFRRHTLAPPVMNRGRDYWHGRGGDVLVKTLTDALKKAGAEISYGTRAVQLRMENGQCVGVDCERGGQTLAITASHVVICDGGYQANLELVRQHISPAAERLKQRNSGSAQGDGLKMAQAVGARAVSLNRFYGHILTRDAMQNEELSPFPIMDFLCVSGIVVDGAARRFVDEGKGGVFIANAIARLPDPLSAVAIFNQDVWDGPGREFISPANPLLTSLGGTQYRGENIVELATALDIDAHALQQAVEQYNQAVAAGALQTLDPPRDAQKHTPFLLEKGPFYAVRLCAGLTYTMGGIAIDEFSRVLDSDDSPIPGLYAAGVAAGGLEGGEQAAYIGGLSTSMVTAFRAANHIIQSNRIPEPVR